VDEALVKRTQERTISAHYSGMTMGSTGSCVMGKYPDMETAMKELDNMMDFFNESTSGSSAVYQIK